jgi:sugar lactone lactonase YvrE
VPAPMVTCPAFGGTDLEDLYITSMTYGLSAAELEEQPLAGAIFRCRPGVKGKLPHRFGG